MALHDQLSSAQAASQTLKNQLEGMQAKLAEAKRTLATLSARQKAAEFRKKMHTSAVLGEAGDPADDAFAKFDRLRSKVEQAEAEADALAELRGLGAPPEPEPASGDLNLEAELQALKQKKGKA